MSASPIAARFRIRHTAAGVNYIDCLKRSGNYAMQLPLPSGIGDEGAGVVEAIGPGTADIKVGDRVVYAGWAGPTRRRGLSRRTDW